MLEQEGYPFKSKSHSRWVERYNRLGKCDGVMAYLGERKNWSPQKTCPKILRYQFTDENTLKISDKCCKRLKEDPLDKWVRDNNKKYHIIGLMREEGGRRETAQCLAFQKGKLRAFQPLAPVTKAWEDWFISGYNIAISDIYKPPYNRERTGCKGCPFAINLQNELDMLEKFFPAERKQCEIIWKPVYDEYRRLGYRLKKSYQHQMTIEEVLNNASS